MYKRQVTIFITVLGTGLSLLIAPLLAYPLSRRDYKRRNFFTFVVFFTMLFNGGEMCIRDSRSGERDFLAFTSDPDGDTYRPEWIDRGRGPANTLHYMLDGHDVLIATNRERCV